MRKRELFFPSSKSPVPPVFLCFELKTRIPERKRVWTMSGTSDPVVAVKKAAMPVNKVSFVSWPRIVFAWPLVLVMALFGLLSSTGVAPSWLNGSVLCGSLTIIVMVREFDFKSYWHVLIGLAVVTIVFLAFRTTDVRINREWFAVTGQASLFMATLIGAVIVVSIGMNRTIAIFDRREDAFTLRFRGREYLLTRKVKIVAQIGDVAEGMICTLGTKTSGFITILQPKDGMVEAMELVIEGVFNPHSVVSKIASIIKPPTNTA